VAKGNRPAIPVDARVVVGNAEQAQRRETLGGEGLVEFDDVELFLAQAQPLAELARSGIGRGPSHAARRRQSHHQGREQRGQAIFRHSLLGGDDQRRAPSLTPEALPAVTVPPSR
jgi:hypothetical protein